MKYSVMIATACLVSIGAPSPGFADCHDAAPNRCSYQECRNRQNNVHPTCDVPRSCQNVADGELDELQIRLTRNNECYAARVYVGSCYAEIDDTHLAVLQSVAAVGDYCQFRIEQELADDPGQ